MRNNHRAKQALAYAYLQWNGFAFAEPETGLLPYVRSVLKPHRVIIDDNEILVVESSFVTMAVHADRAISVKDVIALPGVDNKGQRGFLVLREGNLPFHSLASDALSACYESKRANRRANELLAIYGDKKNLRAAVRAAPWYQLVTEQDLERSGLCRWGSESFLRRLGLLYIARRFGYLGSFLHLPDRMATVLSQPVCSVPNYSNLPGY